jgi:hypothetical protein
MKYKVFVLAFIGLIAASSLFAEKLIFSCYTYDGNKVFTIDFDSAGAVLNFPFLEIESHQGNDVLFVEKELFFNDLESEKEISIHAVKRGEKYLGGANIDGMAMRIMGFPIEDNADEDKDMFPAKYINMRDDTDTISISMKDENAFLNLGDDEFLIYFVNSKMIMLEDGREVDVHYSKGRPYTLKVMRDKRKQIYYRLKD